MDGAGLTPLQDRGRDNNGFSPVADRSADIEEEGDGTTNFLDEAGNMDGYDMGQDDQTAAIDLLEGMDELVRAEQDRPTTIAHGLRIRQVSPSSPGLVLHPPGSSIWYLSAPAKWPQITGHPQAGELANTALGLSGWIPGRPIGGTNTMFAALIGS